MPHRHVARAARARPASATAYPTLPTGVRVHVAEAGPADAPPVLLPARLAAALADLAAPDRPAAGRVHRLICPDLRGHGWSGWPADGDFRKARLADDAVALLDAPRDRARARDRPRLGRLDRRSCWRCARPSGVRSLLALGIAAPVAAARPMALRNAWRFAYQLPLAAPVAGRAAHARTGGFIAPGAARRLGRPRHLGRARRRASYAAVQAQPQAARAARGCTGRS